LLNESKRNRWEKNPSFSPPVAADGFLRSKLLAAGPAAAAGLASAAGLARFFRRELVRGAHFMACRAAFLAGCTRFRGRESVRGAAGVRSPAACGRYFALALPRHRRKAAPRAIVAEIRLRAGRSRWFAPRRIVVWHGDLLKMLGKCFGAHQ
jgi:hypothetical protein